MEESQRITYLKKLYSTKLQNLKQMDNFLNRYHLPKLNQDQMNTLSGPKIPREIEAVVKSLKTKTNAESHSFSIKPDFQRRANTNTPQIVP